MREILAATATASAVVQVTGANYIGYWAVDNNSVFLVTELWVLPNSFPQLKNYRKIVHEVLEKYKPEYIFHNHAFEWVYGGEGEPCPSGIEIVKFENEGIARSAIAALDKSEIREMENQVFARIRCYLSRHDFPAGLMKEIYNQANEHG